MEKTNNQWSNDYNMQNQNASPTSMVYLLQVKEKGQHPLLTLLG